MYQDLVVWQKAYQFTLDIYKVTQSFPKEEMFGITSQIRRASSSIPANLAEGSSRRSPKEFQQFIRIARGSMSEIEVWLKLSYDLRYLNDAAYNALHSQIDEIGRLLNGLLKSI